MQKDPVITTMCLIEICAIITVRLDYTVDRAGSSQCEDKLGIIAVI